MNYTKCFNCSRVHGLQIICSPFFSFPVPRCCQVWSVAACAPLRRSRCIDAVRCGVLQPVPFAPFLVPRCCQVWSVAAGAPLRRSRCLDAVRCGVLQPVPTLRRSWCLDAVRCGVLQPVPLCAVPGASMLSGVECCRRCPFAPFLVPRCCQVWSVAIYIMVYLRY